MQIGDVVQLSQKTVEALTSLGLGDEAKEVVGIICSFNGDITNTVMVKWYGYSIEYPVHISLLEKVK